MVMFSQMFVCSRGRGSGAPPPSRNIPLFQADPLQGGAWQWSLTLPCICEQALVGLETRICRSTALLCDHVDALPNELCRSARWADNEVTFHPKRLK